jgi:hypothetical protein
MKWKASAFLAAYVVSLVLAAYGHCWPMLRDQLQGSAVTLAMQVDGTAIHKAHYGHDHHQHADAQEPNDQLPGSSHDEACAPDLTASAVAFAVVKAEKPEIRALPVPLVAVAMSTSLLDEPLPTTFRPPDPPPGDGAYEAAYARTGRLLI